MVLKGSKNLAERRDSLPFPPDVEKSDLLKRLCRFDPENLNTSLLKKKTPVYFLT